MMKNRLLHVIAVSVLALLLGGGILGLPLSAHAATHLPVRPYFSCDTGTRCYYEFLHQGDYLDSTSNDYVFFGQYRLVMQGDGNLVLYNNGSPVWATGTNGYVLGATYKAILQGDGNFVVYCYNGIYGRCSVTGDAIWATNIYGSRFNNGKGYIQLSGYNPYGNYAPSFILNVNLPPLTAWGYSCNGSKFCLT
jgi:hypothetical protein